MGIITLILYLILLIGLIILGVVAAFFATLVMYTTLWWLPFIFLTGMFTGKAFEKGGWKTMSPFVILEITFKDNVTIARIIGIIYSILALAGSYMFYKEGSSYNGAVILGINDGTWNIILTYYCAFISIMMLLGVAGSFSKEPKDNTKL